MTKLEQGAIKRVYNYLLSEEYVRGWDELDDCLYSLAELEDAQLHLEVTQQIAKHRQKLPKCILDHNHKIGRCMAVTTFAAAKAINKKFPGKDFTEADRYILEHYLALGHLEKSK